MRELVSAWCLVLFLGSVAMGQGVLPHDLPEGLSVSQWSAVQEAYVKASNAEWFDGFGTSVAISGNTVVVGAPYEDSRSIGVNSNEVDNSVASSGAAYVFVHDGATWIQQAYLKASNTDMNDHFGESVAISGDTVAVGAFLEDSGATGVDGDQTDNSIAQSGAVYVFVRNGTTWSQEAYLKASNPDVGDAFGDVVAVSGDRVVVGALFEDSSATGVGGNQDDENATSAGAVYVFVRNGTTWSQEAYLKASNTDTSDHFGFDVAISEDRLLVGAKNESSSAIGVGGDEADNSAPFSGAAYVFLRSGTTWAQEAYLKASNTDVSDGFGHSVGISGGRVVVGAPGEDGSATGVDGDQVDNSAPSAGAAYLFAHNGIAWSQQAYLKASNTDVGDYFGESVGVSGVTMVAGALNESSSAVGVDGDQIDNSAGSAGAAYLFVHDGINWSQTAYLKASNTDGGDWFGGAVAISGDTVSVVAPKESSGATGVNGDQTDNAMWSAGAAYLFNIAPLWTDLGSALPGAFGDPALVGVGTGAAGTIHSLNLNDAALSSLALIFVGLGPVGTGEPFKGGTLMAFPFFMNQPLFTDGSGSIPIPFVMPGGTSGLSLVFQFAISDGAAVYNVALSNGLQLDIQ